MPSTEKLDSHHKALTPNLNADALTRKVVPGT
jgi:hypothetical protein